MNQLDTSTQMNSAASEEVAASAQELSGQAVRLQDVVKELEEILEGKAPQKHVVQNVSSKRPVMMSSLKLVKAS
jgi:methyl-accepting chemotaxis protein